MTSNYLIGVDIGSYSSKGVLVNTDGTLVSSAAVPHTMDMPHEGYFEQDADTVWWGDFVKIVKKLIQDSGVSPKAVLGIGTSAIGSCVLPIDANGDPLRPGILYGIDTRATQETEYLEKMLGQDWIRQRIGSALSSQSSGPKVLWIKNHEPEVYQKTCWFLTSQAYLVYKLTGQATIDIYTASGYAPLFDREKFEWIQDAADYISPIDRLPKAYWSHEIAGKITAQAAKETGLEEGTPVVVGTTDAAAEALSASVSNSGDMMLMIASSIFFILRSPHLIKSQNFWAANFLEKGSFALTGAMSTGGSLTTWFRNQFARNELNEQKQGGKDAYEILAEYASRSPVGSNGLILLPYFEGERTPLNDPQAKGMWFGLGLKLTMGDMYRSILEGVAFGIRNNLEVMHDEGIHPQRFVAVGGGTKNPLWLQIIADACNIELGVPQQKIGACYGDAFLAGMGIGLFKHLSDVTHWANIGQTVHPDGETHEQYEKNYQIFKELYPQTKSMMHKLSDQLS